MQQSKFRCDIDQCLLSESYPKLDHAYHTNNIFGIRARILAYETLSYVNHIFAKNTRSIYTITHLNDTELEKVNTENTLTNQFT